MSIQSLWNILNVNSWGEFSWIVVGLTGQVLFMMRFVVQWITSEKLKRSVVPVTFWYFSLAGGVVLFTYALWRKDPVFIIGQSTGLFIYTRNLWFIHKEHKNSADTPLS